MENEDARTLGAIGALIVELFARQMALLSLLRSQPGFDEESYRAALLHARGDLNALQPLATLRSQASGQRLEDIEKILRGIVYPRQ
jgi:hypothetical protein